MENIRSRAQARATSTENRRVYFFMKRSTDIVISITLLLLLAPLMVFICIRIIKKEGKPIFFRQRRVGKFNQSFIVWKFRTMTNPSRVIRAFPPHPVPASWDEGVPDDFNFERDSYITVTPTGTWIRKYKLHKLPQLWNVLKGDMSLVGPTPEIPEIVDYYNYYQMKRLKVRPGMIGYTQLKGELNYSEKIRCDLFYIGNCSIRMDVKILMQIIKSVLSS
ncbi:sugar transferase [Virgibacillus sp. NKC19-16]|uniref:sugar transferase n=1 Tax=Virgibacillus salidurans TaxID=2831673 RepID=UPI001F334F42|nr:sugar transferase [Virgibacillus sp. NKC19-16]UJL47323.1 sugar transferase [Virgibacillus sp. NKC19-16]